MSSYLDATKPENDDSQLDSQLTVARGVRSAPPLDISTVLHNPPELVSMRQLAFALNASKLSWSTADYALSKILNPKNELIRE